MEILFNELMNAVSKTVEGRTSEELEEIKSRTQKNNYDKVLAILKEGHISGDVTTNNDKSIEILVEWGDWKHEHTYLKYLMNKNGFVQVSEKITEENGSDCYSARHTYYPIPARFLITQGEVNT